MDRFSAYRAEILLYYKQRKAANQLSVELIHPTPANLKEEAIMVCKKRFKESDENVLISFLNINLMVLNTYRK